MTSPGGEPSSGEPIVLFIGGWGRSGSTLLERVLGQIPGFVSVGEIRGLWERGCVQDRPCGCGKSFHACPFWQDVGARAFGGWETLDCHELADLRATYDRAWSVPLSLTGRRLRPQGLTGYLEALDRVYATIAEITGARVIIDSSKIPSHAFLLRQLDLDLRVVHLVRDSRGVAYSWSKVVEQRVGTGESAYMPRFGASGSAVRWLVYNAMTHGLRWFGVRYLFLKYEDFIDDPASSVRGILDLVGASGADLSFIRANDVELGLNHTVDANPMRFDTGSVQLRRDTAFRTKMSTRSRRIVSAITSPLLWRYGYQIGRRRGNR